MHELQDHQKKHEMNFILLGALILFAVLSFFGGLDEIRYPFDYGLSGSEAELERIPYAPVFVCVITVIEVLLLLFGRKILSRGIGLVLNLIKALLPARNAAFMMSLWQGFGGLYSYEYRINAYGWCLVGFGIVIAVLYGLDIAGKWKEMKAGGEIFGSALLKRKKLIRILLVLAVAAFAVLSFTTGIQKEVLEPRPGDTGENVHMVHMIYEWGYLAWCSLAFSLAELCLIVAGKKPVSGIIAVSLHGVKVILPPIVYLAVKAANTNPNVTYSLSTVFTRNMIIFGLIIAFLYFCDILNRRSIKEPVFR